MHFNLSEILSVSCLRIDAFLYRLIMLEKNFNAVNLIIRQEQPGDHKDVFNLIEEAFHDMEVSDHQEQFLVERLRKSNAFVPEVSLVAEIDEQIVGYILLTKVLIRNEDQEQISLTMAPVAVRPDFQRCGIGSALIRKSHELAKKLQFSSVTVLGHADYYPKFGYVEAHLFGIKFPFDVPPQNCMVIELFEGALKNVSGMVEYPLAFFD